MDGSIFGTLMGFMRSRFSLLPPVTASFRMSKRTAAASFMRNKLKLIVLLSFGLVSGCAYNRQFFSNCRPAVPAVRDYAIGHLPELSQDQREFIASTEPSMAQANYVEVRFKWTNVCEVRSSAPPCRPFEVIDLRK